MKGLKDKTTGRFTKNIPIKKECLVCKNVFYPRHEVQKYCSRVCMGKSYSKDHQRPCIKCGKEFSAQSMKTRFCSHKCYGESGVGVRKGSQSHLWKGGITPINTVIRSSGKYLNWVKEILARDNYTCVECQGYGLKFHVDHIIPFSAIMEKIKFQFGIENVLEEAMKSDLLWDTSNGRTLCIECHKKTDTYLKHGAKNKLK